jgi:hypothetical protein
LLASSLLLLNLAIVHGVEAVFILEMLALLASVVSEVAFTE